MLVDAIFWTNDAFAERALRQYNLQMKTQTTINFLRWELHTGNEKKIEYMKR